MVFHNMNYHLSWSQWYFPKYTKILCILLSCLYFVNINFEYICSSAVLYHEKVSHTHYIIDRLNNVIWLSWVHVYTCVFFVLCSLLSSLFCKYYEFWIFVLFDVPWWESIPYTLKINCSACHWLPSVFVFILAFLSDSKNQQYMSTLLFLLLLLKHYILYLDEVLLRPPSPQKKKKKKIYPIRSLSVIIIIFTKNRHCIIIVTITVVIGINPYYGYCLEYTRIFLLILFKHISIS